MGLRRSASSRRSLKRVVSEDMLPYIPMKKKGRPMYGRRDESCDGVPSVWYPATGTPYSPTSQPPRQEEFMKLKIRAGMATERWIGDMLGARRRGVMRARLV